jgi:hypothetical protein
MSIYSNSSDCSFYNNNALYGGALFGYIDSTYSNSSGCNFYNNTAQFRGGAVNLQD